MGTNQWKSGGTHYETEKFIIHENYNNPQHAYDIGLIRVQTPIKFSEKVQPIKLSEKVVGADENLQVTGWGKPQVSILASFRSLIIIQVSMDRTILFNSSFVDKWNCRR